MVTQNKLRELFDYDSSTGIMRWKQRRRGVRRTLIAGCISVQNNHPHIIIGIDNKIYLMHRLVWLYVYGVWPTYFIDHINGDSTDNRIANLRDIPQSLNMQNRKGATRRNKIGLAGVHARDGKFRASVRLNGKAIHLGVFDTKESAHKAYIAGKRKYHVASTL